MRIGTKTDTLPERIAREMWEGERTLMTEYDTKPIAWDDMHPKLKEVRVREARRLLLAQARWLREHDTFINEGAPGQFADMLEKIVETD